jgi:hypothetical protein
MADAEDPDYDPDAEEGSDEDGPSLDSSSSSRRDLNASKSSVVDCAPSRSPRKRMEKIREKKREEGLQVRTNQIYNRSDPDSAINKLKRMAMEGLHSQRSVSVINYYYFLM